MTPQTTRTFREVKIGETFEFAPPLTCWDGPWIKVSERVYESINPVVRMNGEKMRCNIGAISAAVQLPEAG